MFLGVFSGMLGILAIATLEVSGRLILPGALDLVQDVDHRIPPRRSADINSDGIRESRPVAEFAQPGANIVFLGDSFVYGYALESSQSVPAMLERAAREKLGRSDIRVANFGWVSSSPLLSLRLLRDIGAKYHPSTVILGLDMTDFHDDIVYRRLLARDGVYSLLNYTPYSFLMARKVAARLSDSVHERVFGYPADRFFITNRPLRENLHYVQYVQDSIDEIQRYSTTTLGAKFVLIVFARPYQYSSSESPSNWEAREYEPLGQYVEEPFHYFRQLRGTVDYPVYDLLEDFKKSGIFPTAFAHDPHWNADGAVVAAEAIFRHCQDAGCFR